ncbi:Eukaryotic RNA Recognition Motif (RRM) profile [Nakaseomyces glabratus]|nr:Eukaryotic RNA Recognition Motif (RRM) profile [Nakaseomyces glabratus]KAH7593014.1 Eukaryotic RNA Recognition Motif (RRM) profile [Nakaseomyces glabratus]KAH7610858.1 Eukaryotic RNA Recognition Motif (RRM) profile [Nakaseomyces glabratus]
MKIKAASAMSLGSQRTTGRKQDMSLFKARPNLPFKRQNQRVARDARIEPLSQVSPEILTANYLMQFPRETATLRHLERMDAVAKRVRDNQREVEQQLLQWDPLSDNHMRDTDPYKTVFVGRLPYDTDEVQLQKVFAKYGEIVRVRVVRDKQNKSRGYAFVLFKETDSARVCTRDIGVHRGIQINGRRCIVDIERGRTIKFFKPRRLGGGLGGRGYQSLHSEHTQPHVNPPAQHVPQRYGERRPEYQPRGRYQGARQGARQGAYQPQQTLPASNPQAPAEPEPRTSYRSRTARQREEIDY